jgi:hypothetical protein
MPQHPPTSPARFPDAPIDNDTSPKHKREHEGLAKNAKEENMRREPATGYATGRFRG